MPEITCKWCSQPILPGEPSAYAPTVGYHEHMRCVSARGSTSVSLVPSPDVATLQEAIAALRSFNKALLSRAEAAEAGEAAMLAERAALVSRHDKGWAAAEAFKARALAAEARIKALTSTLDTYEAALSEAEAIFGGEYADHYGVMFELALEARAARAALSPAPEEGQS